MRGAAHRQNNVLVEHQFYIVTWLLIGISLILFIHTCAIPSPSAAQPTHRNTPSLTVYSRCKKRRCIWNTLNSLTATTEQNEHVHDLLNRWGLMSACLMREIWIIISEALWNLFYFSVDVWWILVTCEREKFYEF